MRVMNKSYLIPLAVCLMVITACGGAVSGSAAGGSSSAGAGASSTMPPGTAATPPASQITKPTPRPALYYWQQQLAASYVISPDGTVMVTQQLIADAGPDGVDAPVVLKQQRLEVAGAAKARYLIRPQITELVAVDRTNPAAPIPLTVTTTALAGDFEKRLDMVYNQISGPWSPGRHVIDLTYRLSDVYISFDDSAYLAIPPWFANATWYPYTEDAAIRVRVVGPNGPVSGILCADSNPAFQPMQPCKDTDAAGLAWLGDPTEELGASSNHVSFLIQNPSGITNKPLPAVKEEK